MRNIILSIAILACANLHADQITFISKKPELQSEFFKLRPNYTTAIKAGDSAQFLKSIQELKEFSIKIILANTILPSRMLVAGNNNFQFTHLIVCCPGTLKATGYLGSKTVYQAGEYIAELNDSGDPVFAETVILNKKLLEFECPADMTPETIKSADAFISLISKCIDNHDVTCQKASVLKTSINGKKTQSSVTVPRNAKVVPAGSTLNLH